MINYSLNNLSKAKQLTLDHEIVNQYFTTDRER